jgi:hypothetical protein
LQVAGIQSIEGDKVTLTNGVELYPKMLVCATGWNLALECTDRAGQSFEAVQSRLYSRFYDIDYPGLAFVSLSNGFMCATENANLVSQAVAQILLGKWTQPSMEVMVRLPQTQLMIARQYRKRNQDWDFRSRQGNTGPRAGGVQRLEGRLELCMITWSDRVCRL